MGFFDRLKDKLLPGSVAVQEVTNNYILKELVECFEYSLQKESVGTSLLFNAHFLVILHPDTYEARLASLPIIVKETVKSFYKRLNELKGKYEEITPVSASWHFKFGPGVEFNNEPIDIHDIKVIGTLTGVKDVSSQVKTKATIKPKKSNVYDKLDINLDALKHIDFKESGAFTVKFNPELQLGAEVRPKSKGSSLATISYYLGDKDIDESYTMQVKEIVIARKEPENASYSNYLLIDSTYVSNPHARIRFNDATGQFQIASFSRTETRVNERVIPKSDITDPQWFELADHSQILLNGIITLSFSTNS